MPSGLLKAFERSPQPNPFVAALMADHRVPAGDEYGGLPLLSWCEVEVVGADEVVVAVDGSQDR
jgi:hypothetical protein